MLADLQISSALQQGLELLVDDISKDVSDGDQPRAIWLPNPDNKPQCLAYEMADKVDIMGYGGQAGGGKTDLALGLAGTKFHRALILRREYPQLEDVIERGNEIYPTEFVGGSKKQWRFEGRIITLGSMQHEKNWKKYQGRGKDLYVFDEASEFVESQVRKLMGWNRTAREGQHTLTLLCFNPPNTPEGEWIIRFFAPWIDPEYSGERAKPGEIRYFAPINGEFVEVESGEPFLTEDGKKVYPHSRTFIPASRHDNKYLGEDYERMLDALPEPLRTQVKEGDFAVGKVDSDWQVIPTAWVLMAQERGRKGQKPDVALRAVGLDPAHGGKDKTAIAKLYGVWFDAVITHPGVETPKGEDAAQKTIVEMETDAPIGCDVVGYGASAAERLEDDHKRTVIKINPGAGSDKKDASKKMGFANLRSEIYWLFREALNPESGENIALPDDRELRVDLCAATYQVRSGKYVIEPKEDIKERLGRSPDKGEAVLYAWHAANTRPAIGRARKIYEW